MRFSRNSSKTGETSTSSRSQQSETTFAKKVLSTRFCRIFEFFWVYAIDWHVLSALLIPILFGIVFPLYWFVICPLIWESDPSLYRPRSWVIGYWLFASIVWFIFLAICLYHMRNGHQMALRGTCGVKPSESTEDMWNEDKYIPETYLPTPEYFVSITPVQPTTQLDVENQLEAKQELDETWDYNFEETQRQTRTKLSQTSELATRHKSEPQSSGSTLKRKFSNFLSFPVPDPSKTQEQHFDLSSDEEEFQKIQWRSQPNSISTTPKLKSPTTEESFFKTKLREIVDEHHSVTSASQLDNKRVGNILDCKETFIGNGLDRKDSIVTDAKFDLILASLQSLAVEIEKDFQNENESGFSAQRTKSETNLNEMK